MFESSRNICNFHNIFLIITILIYFLIITILILLTLILFRYHLNDYHLINYIFMIIKEILLIGMSINEKLATSLPRMMVDLSLFFFKVTVLGS